MSEKKEKIVLPVHKGDPNPLHIPEYNLIEETDSKTVIAAKFVAQQKVYAAYKQSQNK